jgi:hypothetical protein
MTCMYVGALQEAPNPKSRAASVQRERGGKVIVPLSGLVMADSDASADNEVMTPEGWTLVHVQSDDLAVHIEVAHTETRLCGCTNGRMRMG